MFLTPRWLTLATVLTVGLTVTPIRAAAPEIRDEGKFFGAQAKDQAMQVLERIEQKYKRDVVIETFAKVPEDQREAFDNAQKSAFFRKWAVERARSERVNGIYILICKEPHWFQILEGNQTKRILPGEDLDEVERIFMSNLKADTPDKGLLEGVRKIESTFAAHARGTNTGRAMPGHGFEGSGIMGYVCLGLVVLMGIWIVFGLIRAFTGGGGGGYGGGMGGMGGGGGGFMSSLLGGMFGAAAGMWMYDSFLGHGGSSAWGAGGADPGAGSVGQDTDYTGTGGDYGADDGGGGGGGDWGGGDAGGGDWGGGGDFGGGGGDFGGGGDW